jgi:hypothetical protein
VNAAFVISGAGSWFILAIPQGDFEAVEDLGDAAGYQHGPAPGGIRAGVSFRNDGSAAT